MVLSMWQLSIHFMFHYRAWGCQPHLTCHIYVPVHGMGVSTSFDSFKCNQQDPTLQSIFYCCQSSTCFRQFFHPSSGAQTVHIVSAICQACLLLPLTLVSWHCQLTHASSDDARYHERQTPFDLSYFYGKTKGKLRSRLIKHHATQMHRGVEIKLYMFLSSAWYGGEWSTVCHGHFISGEKMLVPNGQQAGMAAQAVCTLQRKQNISTPAGNQTMIPCLHTLGQGTILSYPGHKYA
jgi:hypothetical protein